METDPAYEARISELCAEIEREREIAQVRLGNCQSMSEEISTWMDRCRRAEKENKQLRLALQEIVVASRDNGLAFMCNWMRDHAAAALDGLKHG